MTGPVEMAELAAERLQGTCKTLADLGPEFEALENDKTFCAVLDQNVFCCDQCDWWHEISEMSESADMVCESCA